MLRIYTLFFTLFICFSQNELLEISVYTKFSNSKEQDTFRLLVKGNDILTAQVSFTIISSNGDTIHSETFPTNSLLGYSYDETKMTKKEYISQRLNTFFDSSNFTHNPIGAENFDEDYSDKEILADLRSQEFVVGFHYTIGEEASSNIAYSKSKNKTVIYFSCC